MVVFFTHSTTLQWLLPMTYKPIQRKYVKSHDLELLIESALYDSTTHGELVLVNQQSLGIGALFIHWGTLYHILYF